MISGPLSGRVEFLKSEVELRLARVLLVDNELPSRLAVQSVLQAAGYHVDVAASGAEAVGKLDEGKYELVLSDLAIDEGVLSYARSKDYRPAIAALRSSTSKRPSTERYLMSVRSQDLQNLLLRVADLISTRAARRAQRSSRLAVV